MRPSSRASEIRCYLLLLVSALAAAPVAGMCIGDNLRYFEVDVLSCKAASHKVDEIAARDFADAALADDGKSGEEGVRARQRLDQLGLRFTGGKGRTPAVEARVKLMKSQASDAVVVKTREIRRREYLVDRQRTTGPWNPSPAGPELEVLIDGVRCSGLDGKRLVLESKDNCCDTGPGFTLGCYLHIYVAGIAGPTAGK